MVLALIVVSVSVLSLTFSISPDLYKLLALRRF